MKCGWIEIDMKTRHSNTERPNSHENDGETVWQSGTGQQRDWNQASEGTLYGRMGQFSSVKRSTQVMEKLCQSGTGQQCDKNHKSDGKF